VPSTPELSIILPCYNEANNLPKFLPKLREAFSDAEIIIVDDGSTDDSCSIAQSHGVKIISHKHNMGNGACIKSGARAANGKNLVFMDADGQHNPADIPAMLEKLHSGYDMVVGARAQQSHASLLRRIGNGFYNWLASHIARFNIQDLTSGFRAVNAKRFREFIHLYPNGFSYPTTCTMAFIRSGYQIGYVPIIALKRGGKSHIRPVKDGLRFLVIIFKIGTLFSPLKVFIPISLLHLLVGVSYYFYTYATQGRFTNMSAIFIIASMLIFLIGLVSEQITALLYQRKD